MDSELKDLEPFLVQFELILPDKIITPFSQFRLLVKASGSDLPCNGKWFQIAVAEQDLSNATIISQPQGDVISLGSTGEWHVELQAPGEMGDYWLHAIISSIETEDSVVEIPFTVKLYLEPETEKPVRNRLFYLISLLSFILGIGWLAFFFARDPLNEIRNNLFSNTAIKPTATVQISKTVPAIEKKPTHTLEDSKTNGFVAELLEQSFNNSSVNIRQKAWQKLSQFIDSKNQIDNPHVQKILQQRTLHKEQMQSWLTSNQNAKELLKSLQVLAFVDDDENAQRWLGDFYASGNIVVKHLGKAWHWYQRSANQGNTKSQQLLADLEARADQLLKSPDLKQRNQGYEVTEAVASAGGVNAQLWMGYRYEIGDGVSRNLVIAANWYRKASEQGNTLASEKVLSLLDVTDTQNK